MLIESKDLLAKFAQYRQEIDAAIIEHKQAETRLQEHLKTVQTRAIELSAQKQLISNIEQQVQREVAVNEQPKPMQGTLQEVK